MEIPDGEGDGAGEGVLPWQPGDDVAQATALAATAAALREEIGRTVVGQAAVVEHLLTALFAGGHALFVGVPGLGKTLLVRSLAQALQLAFARVQFTPDLMPSDITGTEVLREGSHGERRFVFARGPVFCQVLLADEINRAPAKTQAALLEAMQEAHVTAGGVAHALPRPFHVFATQNPVEQEGTYPLPEAQLDRFMMQLQVDYPTAAEEEDIALRAGAGGATPRPVLGAAALAAHQALVARVPVAPSLVARAVAVVRATRPGQAGAPAAVRELVRFGAGPRAAQQLVHACRARALLAGRRAVAGEDLTALALPVLGHRLVLSYHAAARGVDAGAVLADVLAQAG